MNALRITRDKQINARKN